MTRLSPLRQQIAALVRQRRSFRLAMGVGALLLMAAGTLALIFVFDLLFELTVVQRLLLMGASAVAIVWGARRFAFPWLQTRESLIDVALQVEKHQQLDSDVVAALQFESPEAAAWGSSQLEQAVVQYVSDTAKHWNLARDLPQPSSRGRLAACAVAMGAWLLVAVIFPGHVSVFFQRLMLSSAHYPTRTQIEQIVINGKQAELLPLPQPSGRAAYGEPLKFHVTVSGEIPADGSAILKTTGGSSETVVELTKIDESPDGRADFQGELPRMIDSVNFQLYLGDAWTDPAHLGLIELPIVEATLTPQPPSYARNVQEATQASTARQLAVVEGSRVELGVESMNKPLQTAALLVGDQRYELAAADKEGKQWTLAAAETPFARVTEPIGYRIEVVDEDGLSPDRPLQGFIRIKADRPPQIQGSIVTRFVVPVAQPKISFRVADDFGIAKISAVVQVHHEDQPDGSAEEIAVLTDGLPLVGDWLPLRNDYVLDLSKFELTKGDRVEVRMRAVDFRGEAEGEESLSEPLVFQVTDESGVMAAIAETDELSVRKLDDIIKRQLGIGVSP